MNTPIRFCPGRHWLSALVLSAAASVASAQPATVPATVPATAALAQNNNQFALDLYHQFNPSANDNAFFSPYSISTALAMTLTGARNETAAQMAKVLHLAELTADALPPAFADLQKSLNETQPRSGVELYVANSLWPEQNPEHPLLPAFLNSVKTNFNSVVFPVDFINQAAAAAVRINGWVADNTKGKIKDILHPGDLDNTTRLALVNAIYFKAAWAEAFQPRMSTSQPFHLADGGSKPATLMHRTFEVGGYADVTDAAVPFQILSLNYFGAQDDAAGQQGRGYYRSPFGPDGRLFSFMVLLPRANDGLPALEKSLTADKLSSWLGRLSDSKIVEVFLPKFKLEERYSLGKTLKAMGMKDAFVYPTADFSGMNGARDLYIGVVIHQTFIDVDEKGTEAAAATVVAMAAGAAAPRDPPPPPPVFRADHPFLFLIRDNTTGSILFLGRLANPE